MLHLTLEVRIRTPSQDQVHLALVRILDHLVAPILAPTHGHLRTHGEGGGRVVTIVLDQGPMDITVQDQGHPRIEDIIHVQDLQYLEVNLPLSGLYPKGKGKESILTDIEKSLHMTLKPTMAGLLISEIHLKRKDTENGKETIENGMKRFIRAMLLEPSQDPR